MVQWLRLRASTGGIGSIPGRGTKIPPKKDLEERSRSLLQDCKARGGLRVELEFKVGGESD